MNLTEMESKVREATNNEPWGAPSTLMAQIASGTYNYREREEIVAFIFRRFTEKAANEWRQIYKSLQLLDYLIKNGSERIIDDVRANISLIQMLKSFHYIDSKGRDQGINVRNKSKNLIAFLNDDNLIRSERKRQELMQRNLVVFHQLLMVVHLPWELDLEVVDQLLLVMMKILPIESMEMVVFMVNDLMIQLRLITMVPLVMTILKNMMYKPLHLKQHQNLQPALLESMQKHLKRTTKRFIRRFAFV